MNVKIGLAAWQVERQHQYFKGKLLCYCGITLSKGTKGLYLTFVGSINNQSTYYYGTCKKLSVSNALQSETISDMLLKWIKRVYQKNKKILPDIIIIYR